MIYHCMYCGASIRPRDNIKCNGNPDAVSHGPCNRCHVVSMADPSASVDDVVSRSAAMAPACQRVAGL